METYTFNAYGKTFVEKLDDLSREAALKHPDRNAFRAMDTANKQLLYSNPAMRDGRWCQVGTSNEWNWREV